MLAADALKCSSCVHLYRARRNAVAVCRLPKCAATELLRSLPQLLIIRCLLIEPFPESALNEEAGRLIMEDYAAYAGHARMMTSIHAQAHKRCALMSPP